MEPLLGTIIMFGGNFAPRGWAICDGQLLPISQWSALFSILGTTYGGDGRTTFGLPDLRGRVPMGEGNGPGLQPRQLGQKGGLQSVTLGVPNMPAHNHTATLHAEFALGSSKSPSGNMLAGNNASDEALYAPFDPANNIAMGAESITVSNEGGGQPFDNEQPYQVVNFIIATQGVFPSRS